MNNAQTLVDTEVGGEPTMYYLGIWDGKRLTPFKTSDVGALMRRLVVETTLGNTVDVDIIEPGWPMMGAKRHNNVKPAEIVAIASAWCDAAENETHRALRRSSLRSWIKTMAEHAER